MTLMRRFGVDDALLGDLVEQRHAGRSRTWLWRQLLVALLAVMVGEIAAHPIRSTTTLLLAVALRYMTIYAWGAYAPSVDMAIGGVLLDAFPLSRPILLIVVGCANAILLAPVWFGIGFIVSRMSRAALLLFVAVAVMVLLPGVARQIAHTVYSDMIRWLLPVQLALFAMSIGSFALFTLLGAACVASPES